MEGVHLVIETRRRWTLQDLGRLRGRAGVHVAWMELAVVEETRGPTPYLLTLGGTSLASILLLAIRHVGERDLLGRLRHAEELLRARRLGGVAVALHQAYQEFPVAVDGVGILLICAAARLAW